MEMVLLVIGIVLLVIIVGIAIVLYVGSKKRKRKERDRKASEDEYDQRRAQEAESRRSARPVDPQIGDTVECNGVWSSVNGKVSYREKKWTWDEYRFESVDNQARSWLGVEKIEGKWTASLWHDVNQAAEGLPKTPPDSLTWQGVKYESSDDGTASYSVEGHTDLDNEAGSVEYVDYRGAGGRLLSYERFDDNRWEVSAGVTCAIEDIKVYPSEA